MKWMLAPVVLVAGLAGGYFLRAATENSDTTTVVQIRTQAPRAPAAHVLRATVTGPGSACVTAKHADIESDTFTLRRPGDGVTNGVVVGVASSSRLDTSKCDLKLVFSISPTLGFFVVSDANGGVAWGPFDSRKMANFGWALELTYQ